MPHPVLTKGFLQPSTTATTCCHHGLIALTKQASTQVFIVTVSTQLRVQWNPSTDTSTLGTKMWGYQVSVVAMEM